MGTIGDMHKHNLLATPHEQCQETLQQINEYLDGEISDDLCEEIERHISGCPDCQIIIDTLTRTIKLYRTLAQTEVYFPPGVEARLLERLNLQDPAGRP
jgi:anti-sigma factor (TIGR02949 family)